MHTCCRAPALPCPTSTAIFLRLRFTRGPLLPLSPPPCTIAPLPVAEQMIWLENNGFPLTILSLLSPFLAIPRAAVRRWCGVCQLTADPFFPPTTNANALSDVENRAGYYARNSARKSCLPPPPSTPGISPRLGWWTWINTRGRGLCLRSREVLREKLMLERGKVTLTLPAKMKIGYRMSFVY